MKRCVKPRLQSANGSSERPQPLGPRTHPRLLDGVGVTWASHLRHMSRTRAAALDRLYRVSQSSVASAQRGVCLTQAAVAREG